MTRGTTDPQNVRVAYLKLNSCGRYNESSEFSFSYPHHLHTRKLHELTVQFPVLEPLIYHKKPLDWRFGCPHP
jgi:hypothetical protein